MGTIREMLNPQSVALIGATEKDGSAGKVVLTNLLRFKNRPLYLVNPNKHTMRGVPCFPSIRDVPSQVNLAVIITPALSIPAIIRECGEAGVAGAIILSAGFGKARAEEKMLEEEIINIRRKHGIRIIGPNCLGIILPHIGLNATLLTANPKPGNIAFISRAQGAAILDWGRIMDIGFSMFASLGSMIDVGYGDLIDFLDTDTKSIMICMENVGDARRFISAARRFAFAKPIVVLKSGRSKSGADFIAARTGKLPGDDLVYDTVFKRVGAVRVMEMADLFNMAQVLDSRRLPTGPRLAIVTDASDVGIMAADMLAELGGELARISDSNINEPDLFLPERWSRDDPIDMTGNADIEHYINTVKACLRDDKVDGILVIYTPRTAEGAIDLAQALIETSKTTTKPVIVTWMGGEQAADIRRILLRGNVPAYATPEEAVKTYLYMYRYRRNIDLLYETPDEATQTGAHLKNYLKKAIHEAMTQGKHLLSFKLSFDLLKNYQIQTVRTASVAGNKEAIEKARDVGFPLSLKLRCPDENNQDATFLITSQNQVNSIWLEACDRFSREGVINRNEVEIILQKEVVPGSYLMKLASRRDPEFRTIFALSSVHGDDGGVRIGLPPLNKTLARRFLEGARIYGILKSTDAGQRALTSLEDLFINFSNMLVDFAEIERAELILSIWQSDVLVQDIKVHLCNDYDNSSPYSHLVITPYPSHYTTTWSLPNGTEVILRPVRPEDEPMNREMFASLSKETLWVRFFTRQEITRDLLIKSCNTDYDRETAILAEIKENGKKRMIGGIRLINVPDSETGEFAMIVHDDYQRMGLGTKLINLLIGIAEEKRLNEIHGLVLNENHKMLSLCRKFEFDVKLLPDGILKVSLSLKT